MAVRGLGCQGNCQKNKVLGQGVTPGKPHAPEPGTLDRETQEGFLREVSIWWAGEGEQGAQE